MGPGSVAVITGAASGIGLGLARAAVSRGMAVVGSDIDEQRLDAAMTALADDGGNATGVTGDVRQRAEVEALRDEALSRHGRIDLVCCNAGVGLTRPLADCSDADWTLLLEVNLRGVVSGVQTFLPVLTNQGSGHLSATASLSGLVGDPDLAVYATTKFAVVGLMESLQQELRRNHSTVSASVLCPGPVATDLLATSAQALGIAGAEPAIGTEEVSAYLSRGMHPDEVGQIALDGIAAGRFWLLPHADLTLGLLDARLDAMRGGQLAEPSDDWIDQA